MICHCCIICRGWLDGILPLVLDVEAGVQSKCLELIGSTVFDNIVSRERTKSMSQCLAWRLLKLIADDDNINNR